MGHVAILNTRGALDGHPSAKCQAQGVWEERPLPLLSPQVSELARVARNLSC